MKTAASILLLVLLAACSSTPPPPDDAIPPPAERQSELTRLFDRFAGEEADAKRAASEAARGDKRDKRFLASLWGTRSSAPLAAWRYADALSAARACQESLDWYQRAYAATPENEEQRYYLRYEMAEELLALGRERDAIDLLANRLDPEPLPEDLREKYEALLQRAAKGSR